MKPPRPKISPAVCPRVAEFLEVRKPKEQAVTAASTDVSPWARTSRADEQVLSRGGRTEGVPHPQVQNVTTVHENKRVEAGDPAHGGCPSAQRHPAHLQGGRGPGQFFLVNEVRRSIVSRVSRSMTSISRRSSARCSSGCGSPMRAIRRPCLISRSK